MSNSGIPTNTLTESSTVDALIGNKSGSTVQISTDALVALITARVGPPYETRDELYADLAWSHGAVGTVFGDTDARNGVYVKNGAIGSGFWSRIGDLPISATTVAALAEKADTDALAAEEVARAAADTGLQDQVNTLVANLAIASALVGDMSVSVSALERRNNILAGNVVWLLAHDGQSEGVPRGNSRVSTGAPSGARMLNGGVWPQFVSTAGEFNSALVADTSNNSSHNIYMTRLASLVPLAEYADDGGKESICSGIAWQMQGRDTVSWYAGQGSRSVAALSGDQAHLTHETLMLLAFGRLVQAEGKEPVWPFSFFTQGHADANLGTDPTVWKNTAILLQRYRTDLASAVWGYEVPLVPHITEVMNNTGYAGTSETEYANTRAIMQAQSEIAEENDDWVCCGPTYHYDTEDNVHTDSRERRLRAEQAGKVGRRSLESSAPAHCHITGAAVDGLDVTVSIYVPFGSLVVDTALVSDPGGYGFEVFDSGGAALSVSAVVVGQTSSGICDVVVSVASGSPHIVRYAMQSLGYKAGPGIAGTTTGARGNLRDQDPEVALYDASPLYNWLCPKEVTL